MLKNSQFLIDFNEKTGGVCTLQILQDDFQMNFVKAERSMFVPINGVKDRFSEIEFVGAEGSEREHRARYENKYMSIVRTLRFTDEGNIEVEIVFANTTENEEYFGNCFYAITMPVNDCYPDSATCMRERAHAHIWCGENSSYVNCLRMGENENNLGVVLTEGGVTKYSQIDVRSNDRGEFLLHPALERLAPKQSYTLRFELFRHKGAEDFQERLSKYPSYLPVAAEYYTVFVGEPIEFQTGKSCTAYADGEKIAENATEIRYSPKRLGEHVFELVYAGNRRTHASFYVSERVETLLEKRSKFIVEKQQCQEKESTLYGGYLCYDNQERRQFFDSLWRDQNANRERLGMGILVCNYALKSKDEQAIRSLALYAKFLEENVVDIQTGEVCDSERKVRKVARLYNWGWAARFYIDYYKLTGEEKYLELTYKILRLYYERGGEGFYPNSSLGYCIQEIGRFGRVEWLEELTKRLKNQVENFIKNGTNYPAHEVHYEQTIVSPAVSLLTDCYCITGERIYLDNALAHFAILQRFNGNQPDYRLNGISIRFWDDYWFGKAKCFGDTFPHYWSALSGVDAARFGILLADKSLLREGENCLRNNLNLFKSDGSGSCAYVYPYTVNGVKGEFYDELANDQDFALVNAVDYFLNRNPV